MRLTAPIRRCEQCGEPLNIERVETYPDELLGISRVVLIDAVEKLRCLKCPDVSFTLIPDLPGLIAAAAVSRATIPVKLTGNDIRFMRKALSLTAKQLASLLRVTEEAISRWENGKQPIGPASETLLRLMVGFRLREKAPGVDFDEDHVASMAIPSVQGDSLPVTMTFERVAMKIDKKKEKTWMPEMEVAA